MLLRANFQDELEMASKANEAGGLCLVNRRARVIPLKVELYTL